MKLAFVYNVPSHAWDSRVQNRKLSIFFAFYAFYFYTGLYKVEMGFWEMPWFSEMAWKTTNFFLFQQLESAEATKYNK